MGGTLDKASFGEIRAEYAASAVGKVRVDRVGACTLLGPEGPEPGSSSSEGGSWDCTSGPFAVSLLGSGEGYRPYFENYTVDASIFSIAAGPVGVGCGVVKDDLKDH